MKKYFLFIYFIYGFFYFQIIFYILFPVYDIFIDFTYYNAALTRLMSNEKLYQKNFVYSTSFFILSPILINLYLYLIILSICLLFSLILLIKLENNYWNILFLILLPVLYCYNGNIDPFIFLIVLICVYYKNNEYLTPILLSFISFKPTVILIVPYFLYISKNRLKFILYYVSFFVMFNFYMIMQYQLIFDYLNYLLFEHGHYIDVTRPYWIYFTYYYGLKEKYRKQDLINRIIVKS